MQVTKEQLTRISDAWGEPAFMALELLERTAPEVEQASKNGAPIGPNRGSTEIRGNRPTSGNVRDACACKGDRHRFASSGWMTDSSPFGRSGKNAVGSRDPAQNIKKVHWRTSSVRVLGLSATSSR